MSKKQPRKEGPQECAINYKGVHYNDDKDNHYIDGDTGAHFDYRDLFNRLSLLNIEKLPTDPAFSPTIRSVSIEKNKIPIRDFPHSQIKSVAAKPLSTNVKLLSNCNKSENAKKQTKSICIKLNDLNKKPHPATSHSSKKYSSSISKTIDTLCKKQLLSPQNKNTFNHTKSSFSDFNFKSLDNRKAIDVLPFNSPLSKIKGILLPKKSVQAKQNTAPFTKYIALSPTHQKR